MDYELAKELKDAGFPIRILTEEELGHTEDPDDCPISPSVEEDFDGTVYFTPTLSELIEACGDKIHGISRYHNGVYTDGWFACGLLNDVDSFTDKFQGKTPEEAVARLFLYLNRDKK